MTKLKKLKNTTIIAALAFILASAVVFSVVQGSVDISLKTLAKILTGRTSGIKPGTVFIVSNIRLPRIMVSIFVGMSLAVIGTVFQAVFRNPMADPYVMGVSSGAALGATIGIAFGLGASFAGLGAISGLALVGAIFSMTLVYLLAYNSGRITTTGILLAGVVVSFVISSLISLIMILNSDKIEGIVMWTMGSFNGASWSHVKFLAAPSIISCIYLITSYRDLNAMSLSEDEAKSLGVNVERNKTLFLIVSSLLAALAVSVSGIIGFVGLVVPHFFRMIVGANHKILLPTSMLGGAGFMLICDTIARSFVLGFEPPVGIITALVGGPFFLVLLKKRGRRME